ncbi:MAG: nickel/cobalt transporter [Bradyrhizobiaceae bacterium]|nr:nickel/cobalt transporter [Bradyrhizobiaceae bacterium]
MAVLCAALAADAWTQGAWAQGAPFGAKPAAAPPSGFAGWILAEQAKFFRALSAAIREAKADGRAAYGLFWLSFLYGVFHAAGPGHGKAVISAYLVADGATIPRGIALSAAAALVQALSAIALVGVAALALGATARAMGETVRWLEIGAYTLIVAFGLLLAWRKGRALVAAFTAWRTGKPAHEETHQHHDHHAHHAHDHDHEHCGHAHGPELEDLKGRGWLKRGLAAVLAVGIRPCSGAILVLAFALSQGIFLVGVASTFAMAAGTAITVAVIAILAVVTKNFAARLAAGGSGAGMITVRGLEFAAALAVIAVGVLLFTGLMASERMFPV